MRGFYKISDFGHFFKRRSLFFFRPGYSPIFATMSPAPFFAAPNGDLVNLGAKKQKKIQNAPILGWDLGGASGSAQIAF